jgi:hypothetical protein
MPKESDYFILEWNVVPGVPKSSYTPVVGHLVRRETAQDSEWDLSVANEVPAGIVVAVNANSTKISVAEFVAGVTIVLPTTGVVALGDKIETNATALATVGSMTIQRGQVVVDNTNGVGTVVDLNPAGTATATVRF